MRIGDRRDAEIFFEQLAVVAVAVAVEREDERRGLRLVVPLRDVHVVRATGESRIRRFAKESPVSLVVFDLLWLDGYSVMGEPYENRRELLSSLDLKAERWQTPPPKGWRTSYRRRGLRWRSQSI